MMGEQPVYRQLAGELCTQGTKELHRAYHASLYFRVGSRQQQAGRKAKRHKEGNTDLEIVGQCRLTMQVGRAEGQAR